MVFASIFVYLAFAEAYKLVRRRIEQKGQDKRMQIVTTVDPRFVNNESEEKGMKRRVLNRGEKAV